MTHVLMISMDATLLTGAIGDSRTRHIDYAQRAGSLDVVICSTARLDPLEVDALRVRPTRSASRLLYALDGFRAGMRMARSHRPDVITTQDAFLTGLAGLWLRRALHVPLIVQNHSNIAENRAFAMERPMNRVLQQIARQVMRRADAVRVMNQGERAACLRLGLAPDRVSVIPIATDLARFARPDKRIDWRARLGLTSENQVVLWVGRPVYFKNVPLLLDAFTRVYAQLPTARLIIAGNLAGTTLPAQINQLGLHDVVKTAGQVLHADLPSLYQSADVYAHSSRYEGLGLVLIEAAAAGLPLVSVATDGPRDIIHDGETGLLVPADADALADGLLTLLRDPARAQAMGIRARADIMQRFDPASLIAQWIGLWQSVAHSGKAP